MELTILDRDDGVSYADIPHGSAFMWRENASKDYSVFMKPSVDLQLYTATIHAVEVGIGRAVKFDEPEARKFVPVKIESVIVRLG